MCNITHRRAKTNKRRKQWSLNAHAAKARRRIERAADAEKKLTAEIAEWEGRLA